MPLKTLLLTSYFQRDYAGFPLGIAYLASILEKGGHTVQVLDVNAKKISHSELARTIRHMKPDLVGISCNTPTYKSALEIASIARKESTAKIFLGGPHITFCAKTVLEYHPQIDFCILGEGEYTMLELTEALEKGRRLDTVKGLGFRNEDKRIIINPPRRYIDNLDELPFPAWHLFDLDNPIVEKAYDLPVFGGKKSITMITSRGCIYTCSFCSSEKIWGNRIRYRSAGNVVDEIEKLSKLGYKAIFFEDDTFTLDRKRILEICSQIGKRGLSIAWGCGSRVDAVDENLLTAMKKAGCVFMYYGIESGNQEILDMAGKEFTLAQAESAFSLMRKVGIHSNASIQFGLPGETIKTAEDTIRWLKEKLKPDSLSISLTTYYPGSPLSYGNGINGTDYERELKTDKFSNWKAKVFIHGVNAYQTEFVSEENVNRIYHLLKKELGDRKLGGYINI